ncbi:MAG: glycosyltransferase [Acidimicrobiales bacterium]
MSQGPKLRVGLVVPPLPSPRHVGLELAIEGLAKGLHQLGHDVLLYTVVDPMRTKQWASQVAHAARAIHTAVGLEGELGGCDIVHDHTVAGLFVRNLHHRAPLVTTSYGPFDADPIPLYRRRPGDHVPLLAVSLHQYREEPESVAVAAVIHPGIDVHSYTYRAKGAGYLVTFAPMAPDGGIVEAIEVAKATNRALWIYSSIEGPAEHAYFHNVIRPLLGRNIQFADDLAAQDRRDLLARASALIHAVTRDEAFNMAIVEALASGTPTVALKGVADEIIEHGEHGYLADDTSGLMRGVGNIDRISRERCRRRAERYFDCREVAIHHEDFYREVLDAEREDSDPSSSHHQRLRASSSVDSIVPPSVAAHLP